MLAKNVSGFLTKNNLQNLKKIEKILIAHQQDDSKWTDYGTIYGKSIKKNSCIYGYSKI